MRRRWESFRGVVSLWVDLFAEHNLLTYASAIAFQAFIATIAFVLLALGVLAAVHDVSIWDDTIGPAIHARVLDGVYTGMNQIVHKVFRSSNGGLIAFASALAVWEISGVVRALMGALNRIYDTEETRPWWVRFPVSFALAGVVIVALLGALLLTWVVDVSGGWRWPLLVCRWLASVGLIVAAFGILVRRAPVEPRATKWASAGAALVVCAWIVETFVFRWYVTAVADFRSAIGSLLFFIVGASYLYTAAVILLVAVELDELVREDVEESSGRRRLLPLLAGIVRGS